MFSRYKYLIVNFVFPHLGFWSGNLFLLAPFPDRCLLVPFYISTSMFYVCFLVHYHYQNVNMDHKFIIDHNCQFASLNRNDYKGDNFIYSSSQEEDC